MSLNDIEVLPDGRVALILHNGNLPRAMSTHEAKKFAHDHVFGGLIAELKQIAREEDDKAYLLNRAVRTVRASLELI